MRINNRKKPHFLFISFLFREYGPQCKKKYPKKMSKQCSIKSICIKL